MELMLSQLEANYSPDQVVARDSSKSITAAELLRKTRRLAEELRRRAIRVLALQADNSIDWLVIDLACQHADVCLIPLPGFFSASQIRHVLDHAPVDAFMFDRLDGLESLLGDRLKGNSEGGFGSLSLLMLQNSAAIETGIEASPGVLPPATGKITFTSGSTGQPKGVCLSHVQLLQQARALAECVGLTAPRHLCLLPLSTLLENVAGIYSPLLCGGEVILPSLGEIGFCGSSSIDPQKLVQTISRYQPNSIILTPQLLLVLVSSIATGWRPPESLLFVAVGGGKVSATLLGQAREAGIHAFEGYGLSECASVVSLNTPAGNRPGSCGLPLSHLQIRTVNGEIVVAGNAMLGYLGEPSSWGQTEIQTGDLGYLDEQGYLHLKGRKKNLLISSYGRNINPEWVESELMGQPVLSECVVLGDARPYCVALLTPLHADASNNTIQKHIDQVNADLPDYAQVRRWHRLSQPLHSQSGLLTANGRPRREAVLARYATLLDTLYPENQELETA